MESGRTCALSCLQGGPFVVTSPYLAQVCSASRSSAVRAFSPCFCGPSCGGHGRRPVARGRGLAHGLVRRVHRGSSLPCALCEPVPLAHRSEIPAEQRLVARQAILQISTVPREEFLAIETEHYCISHDDWSFEAYHGAAAAAVQEDKGLNRMIYCIVPRCAAPPAA